MRLETNNISSSNEFRLKWLGTLIQSNLYFSRENSRVYFRLYTFAIYFRMHEIWRTANVLIKYATRLYRSSVCCVRAVSSSISKGLKVLRGCFISPLIDVSGNRFYFRIIEYIVIQLIEYKKYIIDGYILSKTDN